VDKLESYRSIVTEMLTKYSHYKPSYGQVEIEQIFDKERDRYHLLTIGFANEYAGIGVATRRRMRSGTSG
jgi:XisI protein